MMKELLDLGRMNLLAAAVDLLLAAADDPVVAVVAVAGEVAGVQPAFTIDGARWPLGSCNNRPSRRGRGRRAPPVRFAASRPGLLGPPV